MTKVDKDFLRMAIAEGKKGIAPYLFGAVVVRNGEIIAMDHSHSVAKADPSAHAEISAIRGACEKLGSHNIPGCTLYASHEPCLMCFCCAAWAEIDRVVFAFPASTQEASMYEFDNVSIFDMAQRLQRPVKVEHVKLKLTKQEAVQQRISQLGRTLMGKYKSLIFNWIALMLFVNLATYAYWERANHQYWLCRAIDSDGDCGLRPDGPMGALLFILIPIGATFLFFLAVFLLKKNKTGKNRSSL
jgi:guanine deaminase